MFKNACKEISLRWNPIQRTYFTANFPYGQISVRRDFLTAKFPSVEISYGEISYGEISGHRNNATFIFKIKNFSPQPLVVYTYFCFLRYERNHFLPNWLYHSIKWEKLIIFFRHTCMYFSKLFKSKVNLLVRLQRYSIIVLGLSYGSHQWKRVCSLDE